MSYADDQWAREVALVRKYKVDEYGEEVVKEWERRCDRYPLELCNYNNVKHLLFRDGYDEGPPKCPRIEDVAKEMKEKKH